MNPEAPKRDCEPSGETLTSEFLILPDGRVLAHNLTPVFASVLAELNPDCDQIHSRITHHASRDTST